MLKNKSPELRTNDTLCLYLHGTSYWNETGTLKPYYVKNWKITKSECTSKINLLNHLGKQNLLVYPTLVMNRKHFVEWSPDKKCVP
jgi:hypothetical protein